MKKVALSLIALLAVGTFAFAEDVAVESGAALKVNLNADASATWGFDLDTKNHGFSNGFNTDLELIFLPEGDSSKTGTGDVYGSILIEDVSLVLDQEDKAESDWGKKTLAGADSDSDSQLFAVGDITAKINFPNGYVKLFTNTDAAVSYSVDDDNDNGGASIVSDDTFYQYNNKYGAKADGTNEWSLGDDNASYSFMASKGITVGYTLPELLAITVGGGSQLDLSSSVQSAYEGQATVGLLAVPMLTLEGKGYYSEYGTAAGVKVAYDAVVAVPFVNFDYNLKSEAYYADFGAKLPIVDGLKAVVAGEYAQTKKFDVTVTANIAQDKLVGPLSADLGFRVKDATAVTQLYSEIFAKVGLKIDDTLKASATVDTYTAAKTSLFARAQLEYTGIQLTTLGVYWRSSDLGGAELTGTSKLGKLYVTAKVAY